MQPCDLLNNKNIYENLHPSSRRLSAAPLYDGRANKLVSKMANALSICDVKLETRFASTAQYAPRTATRMMNVNGIHIC